VHVKSPFVLVLNNNNYKYNDNLLKNNKIILNPQILNRHNNEVVFSEHGIKAATSESGMMNE
jgi:hypothetical protein